MYFCMLREGVPHYCSEIMLTLFTRKKLTDHQLSMAFLNRLLDAVEEGYPEVAGLINESPEFVQCPNLNPNDHGHFLMILLVGNLNNMQHSLDAACDKRIRYHLFGSFSEMFGLSFEVFAKKVHEYRASMARINHPSRNNLSAISRSIFSKYKLNDFQRADYRKAGVPNPQFLQRMDSIMEHFLWNWEEILKHYKIVIPVTSN